MKKLMLAAAAATLLGGCAHDGPASSGSRAEQSDHVAVGSNIPRKKGTGASAVSTASGADVENARMESTK